MKFSACYKRDIKRTFLPIPTVSPKYGSCEEAVITRILKDNPWLLFLILLLLVSGCTPTGYHIGLNISGIGHPVPIKALLTAKGYSLIETKSIQRGRGSGLVERYSRDLFENPGTFYERNADRSLHVDVFYPENLGSMEVYIYNLYFGNDEKLKPQLLEAAKQMETFIRETVPEAKVIRTEYPVSTPLI